MAAHRYWRLLVILTGSPWASWLEIELRSSAGGPDLTGAGTALASGNYPGWTPDLAVDNSLDTGWSSALTTGPFWWGYDFGAGSSYSITELYLTPRQDANYVEAPKDFDWQYSDDGVNWFTQASVEGLVWTTAPQAIGVAGAIPPAEAAFTVEPLPLVRWRAAVPVNEFIVEPVPRVLWNGGVTDTFIRFTVHTAPVVRWITGAGTAGTGCISGDGDVPPRDEPLTSTEENYVF